MMVAAPRLLRKSVRISALILASIAVLMLSAPTEVAAKAPRTEEAAKIYQEFVSAKDQAARGEECIRSKKCPSDESDFLRHVERAYRLQKQLESMASKGNHEAGYLAGLIAYDEGRRFLNEFHAYMSHLDSAYYRSAQKLMALSDREFARAKALLLNPSKAMMPEACLLMGQVLESGRTAGERQSSVTFFYCAAREWVTAGNRELAARAYEGMLRNGKPQDPMLIDIHAKIFNERPENPWRPMEKVSSSGPAQSSANR